jgi:hypothetical protein
MRYLLGLVVLLIGAVPATARAACPERTTQIYFSNGVMSEPREGQIRLAEFLNDRLGSGVDCDITISAADNKSYGTVADLCEAALQLDLIDGSDDCLDAIDRLRPKVGDKVADLALLWATMVGDVSTSDVVIEHQATLTAQLRLFDAALEREPGGQIVIVAHSQGNLFANEVLTKLVDEHGGSVLERLSIVPVATPAADVVGGGDPRPHTTLQEDFIWSIPGALQWNLVDVPEGQCGWSWACHSFVDTYLVSPLTAARIAQKTAVASSLGGQLSSLEPAMLTASENSQALRIVGVDLDPGGGGRTAVLMVRPDRTIVRLEGDQIIATSSTAIDVQAVLASAGTYQFQVIDDKGRRSSVIAADVEQADDASNAPPTTTFAMSYASQITQAPSALSVKADPTTGEAAVTFLDESSDPDGDAIVARKWTSDTPCGPGGTPPCVLSDGATNFTWGFKPGSYNVTLQVTDGRGGVGTATAHIDVAPPNQDPFQGTPATLAFDGASDSRFANAFLGDLHSDANGNLITLKFGPYGSTCGGNFCSPFTLVSISPFGRLNWEATEGERPGSGWIGDDVLGGQSIAIGTDDRIFVESSRDHIRAYQNGEALSGWPFVLGADDTHFTSRLATHPATGDVFASSTPTYVNGTPAEAAAISSAGVTRLLLSGSDAGLWYFGEEGDPYLASGQSITRYAASTMTPVCSGTFSGFVTVGSAAGLIGSQGADVSRFTGDCQQIGIVGLPASSATMSTVGGGRMFGKEYVGSLGQPYDPQFDRLVGIRITDGAFWQQGDIASPAQMVYQQGTLYVIAADKTDGLKQKVFFLDADTGEIFDRLETEGLCQNCRLTATTDGRVYLNDWEESTKIFKLPLVASGTSQFSIKVSNVDDVERIRLNGVEIAAVANQQSRTLDLTDQLVPGANLLEIEVENLGGAWNFGYDLLADGVSVYSSVCGQAGVVGCNGNDQTTGTVFREKFIVVKR